MGLYTDILWCVSVLFKLVHSSVMSSRKWDQNILVVIELVQPCNFTKYLLSFWWLNIKKTSHFKKVVRIPTSSKQNLKNILPPFCRLNEWCNYESWKMILGFLAFFLIKQVNMALSYHSLFFIGLWSYQLGVRKSITFWQKLFFFLFLEEIKRWPLKNMKPSTFLQKKFCYQIH